jgi:hypothetical protein
MADLMVISPNATPFLVDVKGLRRRNSWLVKRKPPRKGLYYILVYLPEDEPNRFYILTQVTANRLVKKHLDRPARNRTRPRWDGFAFNAPAPHEDEWGILPA